MKRKVIVSLLVALIVLLIPFNINKQVAQFQTIPDEAIRLRILANSDSEADQQLKYAIRNQVSEEISNWVAHIDDIEEARQLIANNIDRVEAIVRTVLKEKNSDQAVDVQYGSNITFPMKVYDQYIYPPGEYEAVLITLGEGSGKNWWCVLFPPLCFLDFSDGTTVAEAKEDNQMTEEEIDVSFFLLDWFGRAK